MNVAIDAARFNAVGLDFTQGETVGDFRLIVDGAVRPVILASVPIVGGELQFYPMRSAAQRQVLDMLGEVVSSIQ